MHFPMGNIEPNILIRSDDKSLCLKAAGGALGDMLDFRPFRIPLASQALEEGPEPVHDRVFSFCGNVCGFLFAWVGIVRLLEDPLHDSPWRGHPPGQIHVIFEKEEVDGVAEPLEDGYVLGIPL